MERGVEVVVLIEGRNALADALEHALHIVAQHVLVQRVALLVKLPVENEGLRWLKDGTVGFDDGCSNKNL